MNDPDLTTAFEETWPAAEYANVGGFRVGRGLGAGGRVSSARAVANWQFSDIDAVISICRQWSQPALFRVTDDDQPLIESLNAAGFAESNPTLILEAPVSLLTAASPPPISTFELWPPMAIQREIWAEGKIGRARQAVIDRVKVPRRAILGRSKDRAAGAAFAAVSHGIVMVHCIEVKPAFRRQLVAERMLQTAAHWGQSCGANRVALAVSQANQPAVALYDKLGLKTSARYGYYMRPDSSGPTQSGQAFLRVSTTGVDSRPA